MVNMGVKKYRIDRSNIEGVGVFAIRQIHQGDIIGFAFSGTNILDLHINPNFGSLINHSYSPNTRLVELKKGRYYLVAIRRISRGEELVADYNDTPSFIKKPHPDWE